MLLTMPSARRPCSAIFFEIAGQHDDGLVDLRSDVLVQGRDAGRRGFLQLVQQFDRQPGEVVDEVQRVLDLVGDAGGQLAQGGHLLGMNEARLRRAQFGERRLGGVARGADLGLGALPLGNVAEHQDKAATRDRIATDLDDLPVRPGALEPRLAPAVLDPLAEFGLHITVLAALGEIAEIFGKGRALRQERVRQVQDLLEIHVPGGEAQLVVEHRDAVAHIVKSDAQLGLTLADLLEQTGIVHRDDGLRREALQQGDVLVRERLHREPVHDKAADDLAFLE
jgi:hypothetical protein